MRLQIFSQGKELKKNFQKHEIQRGCPPKKSSYKCNMGAEPCKYLCKMHVNKTLTTNEKEVSEMVKRLASNFKVILDGSLFLDMLVTVFLIVLCLEFSEVVGKYVARFVSLHRFSLMEFLLISFIE